MPVKTPKKFLFVCTGNICRSLMAEKLLQKMASAKGLDWQARSCGVAAQGYYVVPAEIRDILKRAGVPDFEHKAQLVSRDLLRWADLVLTMTEDHREIVVDMHPEFRFKIHVLRSYVGLSKPDVEDPMGLDMEDYERCAAVIQEALEGLLAKAVPES